MDDMGRIQARLETTEHAVLLAQIKQVLAGYALAVGGFILDKKPNPDLGEYARRILAITQGVK